MGLKFIFVDRNLQSSLPEPFKNLADMLTVLPQRSSGED
jgi:hypothetical protein